MRHRQHRLRLGVLGAVLAVLAALAAQLVAAAPAAATTIPPGSVQVFSKLSPFTSDNKDARANCPAGMRVLGGGGLTVGGAHVIMSGARPVSDAAGDGFVVTAQEDQFGVAGTWAVQSFAFCGVAPPGYQVVVSAPQPVASPLFGLVEQCPAGKFAIGAGGDITGGAGQVDLGMFPFIDANGHATNTEALAKTDADGFAGTYTVTSYAICASENVFKDFQAVQVFSAVDNTASKTVTAVCPAGLRATAGAGFTTQAGTHIQIVQPNVANGPSQVKVTAASSVAPAGSWLLRGIVYCAR
jgi:hypothetical protein